MTSVTCAVDPARPARHDRRRTRRCRSTRRSNAGPAGLIDAIQTELDVDRSTTTSRSTSVASSRIVDELGGVHDLCRRAGPRRVQRAVDLAGPGCRHVRRRTRRWRGCRSRHTRDSCRTGVGRTPARGADLDRDRRASRSFIRALGPQARADVGRRSGGRGAAGRRGDPGADGRLRLQPRPRSSALVRALIGVDPAVAAALDRCRVQAAPTRRRPRSCSCSPTPTRRSRRSGTPGTAVADARAGLGPPAATTATAPSLPGC